MPAIPPTLLPAGLHDLLPPHAAHERYVSGRLAEAFERFGYEQVSPPLMEFEASLLASGAARALASQTFRVMDPASQEMLGFRPDITFQVGRIAAGRLGDIPRPLRLAYGGSTLRVKGEGRDAARQWRQAGIECIGSGSPEADAEVIAVAAQAVYALGVDGLVLDINLPGLAHTLLEGAVAEEKRAAVLYALECKDTGSVRAAKLEGPAALLPELIEMTGDAPAALERLERLALPQAAREQVAHARAVVSCLTALGVPVEMTLDPVENRGFEYHSLISFTLFSRRFQSELGRGGRYTIDRYGGQEETATGITLYVNTLMEAVPLQPEPDRILVPDDATLEACRRLQESGYAVIRALGRPVNTLTAHEQRCSHIWENGKSLPVIIL